MSFERVGFQNALIKKKCDGLRLIIFVTPGYPDRYWDYTTLILISFFKPQRSLSFTESTRRNLCSFVPYCLCALRFILFN
jgi:hypothetical protein